ncbi:hypothetical protein HOU02_gp462 [Caulobacter phage CcrBL9]|uniref:Uncharacterized protein n=1 Tax=Caulobacter phage CcrBL9 TaxID=2283270 RepID=A0A385EBV2_9CAUD|nr:hypothetical protein HOU02_gp462 [Caulobacter phage CcrBL9]AXQ69263.1 hypothetical protein CcrBL9_gp239c [Caulobacter phage CcrBL9]
MSPAEIKKRIKVGSRVRIKKGTPVFAEGYGDTPIRTVARPSWVNVNVLAPRGKVGWIGSGNKQFLVAITAIEDMEDFS